MIKVYSTPCMCFGGARLEENGCICSDEERVIRARMSGALTTPLGVGERQWCVDEAVKSGEGYYRKEELEAMDDQELCRSVMEAWLMYIQGLL